MYSYEIEEYLRENDFKIDNEAYLKICSQSPQICKIKFNPYNNVFEIWTNDDYYFKFEVCRKEKKWKAQTKSRAKVLTISKVKTGNDKG